MDRDLVRLAHRGAEHDAGAIARELRVFHRGADRLSPAARVAIYRHHVTQTLTDILMDVYPVVCRLVDARFFAYAAHRFIASQPPMISERPLP